MKNKNSTTQDKNQNQIPSSQIPRGLPVLASPLQNKNPVSMSEALDGCTKTRSLITSRLKRLQAEKDNLNQYRNNYNNYAGDIQSVINLRTLANAKGQLGNPNLYSHQFMDPIYYPLEMPISAEPVTLPKIEMGVPMQNKSHQCCGMEDLLALLAVLKRRKSPQMQIPQIIIPPAPQPVRMPTPKRKRTPIRRIPKIPENQKQYDPNRGLRRDWWKLAKDFIGLYNFFSTANKYSKFGKIRSNMISQRMKTIVQEISVLKDWIISIEEPFWNEFKVFNDLDVSFKNIDSKLKIQRESQKIIALIKKYLENLITRSTKLSDIPERVQTIIYNYIRERAYFPKKYMSTFQINRIDFNFYGGIKNLTEEQMGMLVAFLLISCVTVQQILLHMKEAFVEFRNYPKIDVTCKYIGSILHYLTRDTFQNNPTMVRELLALLNYYRNYHLYNEMVEKQTDIFNSNMVFLDADEFAEYLVPENQITEFWNLNGEFCDMFKNYVYAWACKLGKLIRLKYQKTDVNLLPKKQLQRPQDKTVTYDIEYGTPRSE